MHLWFLEVLLVLYALAVAAAWAGRRWNAARLALALDRGFELLFRFRGKAFALAALTMIPLWNGPGWGEVDHMGASLLLAPRAIIYFGLFFAVGWWLNRHIHLLDMLREGIAIQLTIAFLALVAWFGCIIIEFNAPDPPHAEIKMCALAGAALYAWTMTFALTGLFLRIASRARPWARYLADASYWCYLAHLPLIFVLQVWVARWELPGWLKAWLIIALACALLLASYALFVRYTRLGTMLNGPRERPVRASA
jgi:peptidoglycan/LPS O-acetylase OafA/YrhL